MREQIQVGLPTAVDLAAVAAIWKNERRELVSAFGGTSMLPSIAPGQPVKIQCGREPRVGEVALFRLRDSIGLHRVVARGEGWLMTWGDANALPDHPIAADALIGTVADIPPFANTARRAAILRVLSPVQLDFRALTRRVDLLYRMRAAWRDGALVLARKAVRIGFRRVSSW